MAAIISRKSLDADDTPGPVVDLDPGALIDEVPASLDYKQLMADVAFMREPVKIMVHPRGQQEAEVAIPIGVNGDRAYVIPGLVTGEGGRDITRRYHVAQLLKARPDYVSHVGGEVGAPEGSHNRFNRQSTSRYNFDVVEDTARGIAWLKELRRHYTRR
jgi:hypothetical protein